MSQCESTVGEARETGVALTTALTSSTVISNRGVSACVVASVEIDTLKRNISRTSTSPATWSASGGVSVIASRSLMPIDSNRSRILALLHPPFTRRVSPVMAVMSVASPCPTSMKSIVKPAATGGGSVVGVETGFGDASSHPTMAIERPSRIQESFWCLPLKAPRLTGCQASAYQVFR